MLPEPWASHNSLYPTTCPRPGTNFFPEASLAQIVTAAHRVPAILPGSPDTLLGPSDHHIAKPVVIWMDGWMDEWMVGWMDEWIDGLLDGWTFGWMEGELLDGWMDGWKDGLLDGWIVGWKDGLMDMKCGITLVGNHWMKELSLKVLLLLLGR